MVDLYHMVLRQPSMVYWTFVLSQIKSETAETEYTFPVHNPTYIFDYIGFVIIFII